MKFILDNVRLLSESGCEMLCFDMLSGSAKTRIILVYRPLNSYLNKLAQQNQLSALVTLLEYLTCVKYTTFICGDFNFPDIDWIALKTKFDGINDVFLNAMSSLGMTQFVSEPTRLSSCSTENVLDLIFSNDSCSVQICDILPPISTSDHNVIEFTIFPPHSLDSSHTDNGGTPNSDIILTSYNWNSANFQAINEALLMIDWHVIFGYNFDVETIWLKFKSIIWLIIDLYVPKTILSHQKKYKHRQYPREIQKLLNRKAAIWRKLKQTKTDDLKSKYALIVPQCKSAIFRFDLIREEKLLNANNLGAFYRFINGKLRNKSNIALLTDPSGQILLSDADKANLLNNYFKSVFTQDNGTLPHFPSRLPENSKTKIDDIKISEAIVRRILSKLKNNSAPGPDRLPPIFYKNTSTTISYPLSVMYRAFIDLRSLPDEWKHSVITPKLKKGNPSLPSNYRPIALTCNACKILESIISSELNELPKILVLFTYWNSRTNSHFSF